MTTLIGIGGLPRSKGQAHIIADTLSAVVTNLNALAKKSSLLGSNILIRTMDVPDLWIDTVENTSVQYTYVSDAQMIADINSAYSTAQKGLQIGYYRVLPWEGAKIDLSEYRKAANQDIIDNALDARLDEIEGKESDWDGKYAKPSTGIPSSDMSSDVQTSLGKANSALQEVPNTYRTASEQDIIDGILSDGLDKTFDEAVSRDSISLPTLCGQPMKLFGAGTPQAGIVPINWKQLADGGYNWNGLPSALGQEYINTSAATNGHYTAVPDGYALKWVNF